MSNLRGCGFIKELRQAKGIFQMIFISQFSVWWDSKVYGFLEKTIIIPRLLQPARKLQDAKSPLRIGWPNYKQNYKNSLKPKDTF
jgi:hypothetical protein